MKWTNHPRIFFEVAVVKLCQSTAGLTQGHADADLTALTDKINRLEQELSRLRAEGVPMSPSHSSQEKRKRLDHKRVTKMAIVHLSDEFMRF